MAVVLFIGDDATPQGSRAFTQHSDQRSPEHGSGGRRWIGHRPVPGEPLTSITGIMQDHLAADQHATLVPEDEFDPNRSLHRLNQWGATMLGGAPVVIERLVGAADARADVSGPSRAECRLSRKDVALGGTMLSRPLLDRLALEYGIRVCRVYGSSEAPVSTGSLPDDGPAVRLSDDGAIVPGTEVKVGSARDPREALLVGPNLFLGYLDTANNAEAFEAGWYRTGDLVETTGERLTVFVRSRLAADAHSEPSIVSTRVSRRSGSPAGA